jgi:hypothetical protein
MHNSKQSILIVRFKILVSIADQLIGAVPQETAQKPV